MYLVLLVSFWASLVLSVVTNWYVPGLLMCAIFCWYVAKD
jgi:hypothetical protein